MSESSSSDVFHYPTSNGVLRSLEDYARHYLPAMHDINLIAPRMQMAIDFAAQTAADDGPRRWLDYGAGGGVFAYHLARRCSKWSVVGWESDWSSLQIANRYFSTENVSFEQRPFSAYVEMGEAEWDGIAMLEVIEHVDDAGPILSSFHRALRPNGQLLLSTPNFLGWPNVRSELRRRLITGMRLRNVSDYVRIINERPYDPATDSGHISTHSVWTLTALLKKHGYVITNFGYGRLNRSLAHRLFPDTLIVMGRKS